MSKLSGEGRFKENRKQEDQLINTSVVSSWGFSRPVCKVVS